jgi:hypothetical protein
MDDGFIRHSVVVPLSREQALDYGIVEPTEAEAERREREMAEYRARKADADAHRRVWLSMVDDIAGPVGRAVLALHHRDDLGDCVACGHDCGGLGGHVPWPCPTVDAVADACGLQVPEGI